MKLDLEKVLNDYAECVTEPDWHASTVRRAIQTGSDRTWDLMECCVLSGIKYAMENHDKLKRRIEARPCGVAFEGGVEHALSERT